VALEVVLTVHHLHETKKEQCRAAYTHEYDLLVDQLAY
jgi:hypothetical protein